MSDASKKLPGKRSNSDAGPLLREEDIAKIAGQMGVDHTTLMQNIGHKFHHDQLEELIQPLLRAFDESGDEQEKSLEQESENERDKEELAKDGNVDQGQSEEDAAIKRARPEHNKLQELLDSSDINLDTLGIEGVSADEYSVGRSKAKWNERERNRKKIMQIMVLIEQLKSGSLDIESFKFRANMILPLKTTPGIKKFLEQNGVNLNVGQQARPQRIQETMRTHEMNLGPSAQRGPARQMPRHLDELFGGTIARNIVTKTVVVDAPVHTTHHIESSGAHSHPKGVEEFLDAMAGQSKGMAPPSTSLDHIVPKGGPSKGVGIVPSSGGGGGRSR